MANSVDERVVSMKFDNGQFEEGAKESMSTIDKLLAKLKLTDSAEGFSNLDKAAKGIDLSGISSGVDAAASKFNALETMAVGALLSIGRQVSELGINLVKSLSVDQINAGLNEYEQKMGSVQTLLYNAKFDEALYPDDTSKMEKIKDVMEDLNKYSDDTIYSFADMKSAMAKFVNAGVDLDDSSLAIKGIANVAALSGANAQEAGRAYYNLAQSLSTGSLKLIDWKSIENANMASIPFKQTIIDVAREMGALDDELGNIGGGIAAADVTAENFRETISGVKGQTWVTNEVLLAALAKFGDKSTDIGSKAYQAATEVKTLTMLMDTLREAVQSGWAETFEIIIGDFFEAKDMWTAVSNEIGGILGDQAKARNALLKDWKELGGRDSAMQSFVNVWTALKMVLQTVKDVVAEIFPPITGQTLYDLTKKVEAFTESLIPTQLELDLLKQTLRRIIPWFKVVFEIFKSFGKVGAAVGRAIMSIAKAFGYHLQAVTSYGEELQTVDDVCQRIVEVTEQVVGWIDKAADSVSDFIMNFRNNDYVAKFLAKLESMYDFISGKLQPLLANISFEKIGSFFMNFESYLPTKEDFIGYFVGLWDDITKVMNGELTLDDLFGVDNLEGADAVNVNLKEVTDNLDDYKKKTISLSEVLEKLSGSITSVADGIKIIGDALKTFMENIDWGLVLAIGLDVAIMYGAYKLFGFITTMVNMALGLSAAVTNIVNAAKGVLVGFAKIEKAVALYINAAAIATSLMKLAIAFAIIAGSLALLTHVDQEKLKSVSEVMYKYLVVLVIAFSVATLAVAMLSRGKGSIKDAGDMFFALAAMIVIIAGVMYALSEVCDPASIKNIDAGIKGFLKLTIIVAAFAVAMGFVVRLLDKWRDIPAVTKALSGFIIVLAAVLYICSEVGSNADAMWQGIYGFESLIAVLMVLAYLLAKLNNPLSGANIKIGKVAVVLGVMALTILTVAAALYILGKVDFKNIFDNWELLLGSFVVLIGGLIVCAHLASEYGVELGIELAGLGIGLLAAAAAFYLLSKYRSDKSIRFALMFIAGYIGVVTLVAILGHRIQSIKSVNSLVLTMLGISAALLILTLSFVLLQHFAPEKIFKGAIGLLIPMLVILGMVILISRTAGEKELKMSIGIVMSLAALIVVLGAVLILLSLIPADRLGFAMLGLAFPLLGLVALMAVIMYMSDHGDETSIKNLQSIVYALAVFVGVFAAAVIVMSKLVDTDKLIPVMVALGLGLAALAVMMLIISKLKVDNWKESLLTVGLAVVLLAALTASLAVLGNSNLDAGNMIAGMAALVALVIVIGLVVGILGQFAGGKMVLAAAAMVIVAAAILVLAGALWVLCQLPTDTLKKAAITIGVLFLGLALGLTLIAALAGVLAAPITAGAIALSAFGGALIMLGLGLIAIVASVAVLGVGLIVLGKGLEALGVGVHSLTDDLVYFTACIPELCTNLALGLVAFYDFMVLLSKVGPKIATLMGATATMMIAGFLLGLADGIPSIIQAAFILIISFIDGLATAIDDNAPSLFAAMSHLHDSIMNAILGFFGMGSKDDESSEMKDTGDGLIGGLISGISEGYKNRHPILSGIADGIKKALNISFGDDKAGALGPLGRFLLGKDYSGSKESGEEAGSSYASGVTDGISSEESKAKVSSAATELTDEANKALEENKPEVHIMTEQDARMQAEQKKAGASAMESFTDGAEEYLSGEGTKNRIDSLRKGFFEKINLPGGDFNIEVPDFLGSIGLSGDGFNAAGIADGESYTNGLMGALQNGGLGDIPLDNLSLGNIPGLSTASLAPMFESGSGTSTDPGQISAVLSVDTESAQEDIYNMMDATQLTKVVGQDVHGKIDATYTSSAAEMAQRQTMMEGVMNSAVDKINAAVANLPQPINKVEVKIAGDMQKFLHATQKEAMEYQKRTGKPAFG